MLQRTIHLLVLGVCSVTSLPAAAERIGSGFYLGVGAGRSSVDMERSELDGAVFQGLAASGAVVTSGASKFEDSDTSLTLFGGYHFNRYIAIEASYIDFGTAEFRSTGTVNPPGPVFQVPASVDLDFESRGATVAALGSLPLGTVIDLHGRGGLLFARSDLETTVRIGASQGSGKESLDSVSGFVSAGVGFHLGERWTLSLDWSRYFNVGDEDDDENFRTRDGSDVDTTSIGASYRF